MEQERGFATGILLAHHHQCEQAGCQVSRPHAVILDPADYNAWLDPENQDTDELQRLLEPYSPKQMSAKPVSTFVNNVKNQGPECVEPLGE